MNDKTLIRCIALFVNFKNHIDMEIIKLLWEIKVSSKKGTVKFRPNKPISTPIIKMSNKRVWIFWKPRVCLSYTNVHRGKRKLGVTGIKSPGDQSTSNVRLVALPMVIFALINASLIRCSFLVAFRIRSVNLTSSVGAGASVLFSASVAIIFF